MFTAVRHRLPSLTWIQLSLLTGGILAILTYQWTTSGLTQRVLRDVLLYLLVPLGLGITHGRRIGWQINRRAIRNAVILSLFVLPFYLVGSTLPTIREYYPMWHTTPHLGEFVPHAIQLFVLALATETYYRGLLCVGVRDLGFKCVFISPVLYAAKHYTKPPIEFLLSAPTDVLFGAVDYDANSILPSVVAHGFGLVLLDWLVLHDPIIPPETTLRWLSWVPVPL